MRGAGTYPAGDEDRFGRRRLEEVRVCFLFNHDQVHQVAHSLPVALALARASSGAEIILATTTDRLETEVDRLGGRAASNIRHVLLRLNSFGSRALSKGLGRIAPADKLLIYRDNLDFFGSIDILVVSEKTSLALKTRYGQNHLRIVHTRHGAGDRAIGFDRASSLFDRVLVSGAKVRERLIAEAGVDPARISIVGYPKFDMIEDGPVAPLFDNGKPTVLYNPHASPHLSSWYGMGSAVLDHFAGQDRYNLVFAPHVMLFERAWSISIDRLRIARPGRIARRHREAPNIHIDLGSPASTDMTYTDAVDIYLGDVSSQVYEFLRRPRPCVFLDPNGTPWRGDANYTHWASGPIVERVGLLGDALDEAVSAHVHSYKPVQEALFARSFDLNARPSSDRAAAAIMEMIGEERIAA